MSLRNVGAGPTGTLSNQMAPSKNVIQSNGTTKYLKHVNLMNLTAIKRVVDVVETQTDADIFALVCRTNQVKMIFEIIRACLR